MLIIEQDLLWVSIEGKLAESSRQEQVLTFLPLRRQEVGGNGPRCGVRAAPRGGQSPDGRRSWAAVFVELLGDICKVSIGSCGLKLQLQGCRLSVSLAESISERGVFSLTVWHSYGKRGCPAAVMDLFIIFAAIWWNSITVESLVFGRFEFIFREDLHCSRKSVSKNIFSVSKMSPLKFAQQQSNWRTISIKIFQLCKVIRGFV